MSQGEKEFEKIVEEWIPNPKAAELEFLDLELPKYHYISKPSFEIPCFHIPSVKENHSLGKISTDPITTTQIDLNLTILNNLSKSYERLRTFAVYQVQKNKALEEKLDSLIALQARQTVLLDRLAHSSGGGTTEEVEKPIEKETLAILKQLEGRLKYVEDNLVT